MGRRISW